MVRNLIQMVLKWQFFFEKSLRLPSGLELHLHGLRLQTLSVIRVSCLIFLSAMPLRDIFQAKLFHSRVQAPI